MPEKKPFVLYNTLSREKVEFKPINPSNVGLYACGPTVYSDPHLGHARQAITYDILVRYLDNLGYTVRYVRNITDVGHLEDEVSGEGEDKIAKKARLEQLEPMEVVQHYTNRYHLFLDQLNVKRPSIEPRASGHITEQKKLIEKLLSNGFAYVAKDSIYFDVEKYNEENNYGKLSGRKIEDLRSNTRELEGQTEKKNSLDFALWKKASPEHIMKWKVLFKWKENGKRREKTSKGFPGWHLECSAMSNKYLGEQFDIHGGGMDLLFPHHECEIAQTKGAYGKDAVKYWMHNNMITINGQKMSRSLNNFITLDELFKGNPEKREQAYSPMTVRFFILQAHYRSTLDFSNEALQASEKGLKRLFQGLKTLEKLNASEESTVDVEKFEELCYNAMSDDLNTPVAISHLFDAVRIINSINDGKEKIDARSLDKLKILFHAFISEILGLTDEESSSDNLSSDLINMILNLRMEIKANKDYATADKIRDELTKLGIVIKDKKDGFDWEIG